MPGAWFAWSWLLPYKYCVVHIQLTAHTNSLISSEQTWPPPFPTFQHFAQLWFSFSFWTRSFLFIVFQLVQDCLFPILHIQAQHLIFKQCLLPILYLQPHYLIIKQCLLPNLYLQPHYLIIKLCLLPSLHIRAQLQIIMQCLLRILCTQAQLKIIKQCLLLILRIQVQLQMAKSPQWEHSGLLFCAKVRNLLNKSQCLVSSEGFNMADHNITNNNFK